MTEGDLNWQVVFSEYVCPCGVYCFFSAGDLKIRLSIFYTTVTILDPCLVFTKIIFLWVHSFKNAIIREKSKFGLCFKHLMFRADDAVMKPTCSSHIYPSQPQTTKTIKTYVKLFTTNQIRSHYLTIM